MFLLNRERESGGRIVREVSLLRREWLQEGKCGLDADKQMQ